MMYREGSIELYCILEEKHRYTIIVCGSYIYFFWNEKQYVWINPIIHFFFRKSKRHVLSTYSPAPAHWNQHQHQHQHIGTSLIRSFHWVVPLCLRRRFDISDVISLNDQTTSGCDVSMGRFIARSHTDNGQPWCNIASLFIANQYEIYSEEIEWWCFWSDLVTMLIMAIQCTHYAFVGYLNLAQALIWLS